MYEPKIGETVWFVDDFYDDDDLGQITHGVVSGVEVVDRFNGYKSYTVNCEGDALSYNLSPYALYKHRTDIVREILEKKMDELVQLQREIANLEMELEGEQ
jgi:hypothetical protein